MTGQKKIQENLYHNLPTGNYVKNKNHPALLRVLLFKKDERRY
jgi:hypothetical protein